MEFFSIHMVPGGGIEPTTLSLEGFCSSTELPGQEKVSSLQEIRYQIGIFNKYFSERRIVRMERKSNRFIFSFSHLLLLFFRDSLRMRKRSRSIKIVDSIDIDDLPPLFPELIADDHSDACDYQVGLSREHRICESYDIPEWDDTIDHEGIDDTKIEAHEEKDKKCHHQEHVIESFHRFWGLQVHSIMVRHEKQMFMSIILYCCLFRRYDF